MRNLHIYIHVPYCVKKCNYCAFYSVCDVPDWDAYLDEILNGIDSYSCRDVISIFFGGGTPSLMPTDIFARIISRIREKFNLLSNAEITIECNPGTIDINRLREFVSLGVNRVSVGVQSFNDDELKFLGRIHNADEARKLISDAQDLGITVSADFIYGLPNHTLDDIKNLCNEINKLNLNHCSVYELVPENKFKNLAPIDNDLAADMYEYIGENLNLKRYEVSNYGTPCIHNSGIWNGDDYIGIGRGAVGMSDGNRAVERVIMGLRTTRGVELTDDVLNVIDLDVAKKSNMFKIKNNRLIACDFLLLDTITMDILK